MSNTIRFLAKGSSISFFAEICHVFIIYSYGILIARYLGSRDYGIFFLGITIFNLICMISLGGVEDTLMRFVGMYSRTEKIQNIQSVIRFSFYIALTVGSGLGLLCFFLKDILADNVFHKPELSNILSYFSIAIPVFAIMTISVASIRSYQIIFPYVFVRKIFFPLISLILGGVVLAVTPDIPSLSLTYFLSVLAGACLGYLLFKRYIPSFAPKKNQSPSWTGKKDYFSFLSTVYIANVLLFLFAWSDMILLGILATSDELGIYFAAKRTALAIGIILVSLNVILGPMVSHLYAEQNHNKLHGVFKTGTLWTTALGIPVFLMFVFFSTEILSLFGADFVKGNACLIILSAGQFINLSVGSVGYLLLMTGHQKWMLFNAAGAVTVNALLMTILVPRYGINGAAWSTATSLALTNIIAMLQVYFLLDLHPYSVRYGKFIILGCVTAASTWIIKFYMGQPETFIAVIAQISSIFTIFFLLLLIFGVSRTEKLKLQNFLSKYLHLP